MKKVIIGLISLLIFLFVHTYLNGQTTGYYEYSYDDAGNRIHRAYFVIVLKTDDSIAQDTSKIVPLIAENTDDFTVSVFPNPTYGLLNLKISTSSQISNSKYIISGENGMKLSQKESLSLNEIIDMSKFSAGNYYLKLWINNWEKTYKIIKTK